MDLENYDEFGNYIGPELSDEEENLEEEGLNGHLRPNALPAGLVGVEDHVNDTYDSIDRTDVTQQLDMGPSSMDVEGK